MTRPRIMASVASSSVTGMAFLSATGIGSLVKIESPGLRLTICQTQSAYCCVVGQVEAEVLAELLELLLADVAGLGHQRRQRVAGHDAHQRRRRSATTARAPARPAAAAGGRTCTSRTTPASRPLLVEPGPGEGRRAVPVGAPQRRGPPRCACAAGRGGSRCRTASTCRSTWSYSRSTIFLVIARCSARSGVRRSLVVSSSMTGSLTRKKFFVDLRVHVLVRPLVERRWRGPTGSPTTCPSHLLST